MPKFATSRSRASLLGASACLLALLLGPARQGQAQGIHAESFQNTDAPGFRIGGSAELTAASGLDAAGTGFLRLTNATVSQAGFAIDNAQFATSNGFSIAFEFFAYGGAGKAAYAPADGFSMFLVDADKTTAASFVPGAPGGSLGYAQIIGGTNVPDGPGVPFGYFGIGLDEFGNFSSSSEGRVGGRGTTPDAVAIRGAGNGSSPTDYPYLTGTETLPFSIDVASPRAEHGTEDYRRAFVDVIPANGTYQVTVRIQHGSAISTVVRDFVVPIPPANLRIGFAGSTGAGVNVHEIRYLVIKQAPFLRDDEVTTAYNQAVTTDLLANDTFQFTDYASNTIDLDISQDGIQSSLAIPGTGTFTVTPQGVVTFTPSGSFSGTISLPYTATDQVDQVGAPANLTVVVTPPAPMPVTLTSFSVEAAGPDAQLKWATASEQTNDHFVVERSLNGSAFSAVGAVAGQGTTAKQTKYTLKDVAAAYHTTANQPLYYRLRQVDQAGTSTYSAVQSVVFGVNGAIGIYPNPADHSATLNLSALPGGSYQVLILDLTGQQVASYVVAGGTQQKLDLQPLLAGTYVVRITGLGGSVNQALLLRRQ